MRIRWFFLILAILINCKEEMARTPDIDQHNNYEKQRQMMVQSQIKARGVLDERVLSALRAVPRHEFVPDNYKSQAYQDYPLPIGFDQTISQPYIVAYMSEMLKLKGDEKVLEIGTGSGYQAAVLSHLAKEVYTIEIIEPLCKNAEIQLKKLGYDNCFVRCGDGYQGWPESAPFDAIIVTAAPEEVPQPLINQLKEGGRMIIPVGRFMQYLRLFVKNKNGSVIEKKLIAVRFVPMTGESQNQ